MTDRKSKQDKVVIMFVDDDKAILSSIRRLARKIDCRQIYVESSSKALFQMEKQTVDIVVSDMRMPDMNGAELLTLLAEKYPNTIRVAFSGYSDEQSNQEIIEKMGLWGYIEKPWSNTSLLGTISELVGNSQMRKGINNADKP